MRSARTSERRDKRIAISELGQARPGRASSKSGNVRYAESGSKFKVLATQRRAFAG
jgi:hypothetical protein